VATRDDHLGAGEAASVREDREHHRQPCPVDAQRRNARRRALGRTFLPDEVEDDPLPGAYLYLRRRRKLGRRALERRRILEQRAAGHALSPGPRRSLSGSLGGRAHHRFDPVLDRHLELRFRSRRARDDALEPVAKPADAGFERAHDVARSDDLMPPGQHLPAQQRAAPQRGLHLPQRICIGMIGFRAELRGGRELLHRSPLDDQRPHGQARQRPAQRPPHERRPRLRVGREPVEPGPHRPERAGRQQLLLELDLRDDENLGVPELLRVEHLPQVRRHLPVRVRRHPVQHDREHRSRARAPSGGTPKGRRRRSAPLS